MLYHIASSGLSIESFRLSLARAIACAMEDGSYSIAITMESQINLSDILYEVLGEKYARRLEKNNNEVKFSGVSISLLPAGSLPGAKTGALLAVNTSPESTDKLIACEMINNLIYIPYNNDDLDLFLREHRSEEI